MDGNGRWANERSRPRVFGHIKGARVAKKIITQSVQLGIKNLTLYAFSTENWNRPADEVSFLIRLLQRYLARERRHLFEQNVRFNVIGEYQRFPPLVVKEIELTMERTKNNSGLNLSFALNYGGRQELVSVMRELSERTLCGELKPDEITESLISEELEKRSVGEPDLLIRTSGELRLSNFLIWQSTYSELYFTPVLWPDFDESEMLKAIDSFQNRERRFGHTSEQIESSIKSTNSFNLLAPVSQSKNKTEEGHDLSQNQEITETIESHKKSEHVHKIINSDVDGTESKLEALQRKILNKIYDFTSEEKIIQSSVAHSTSLNWVNLVTTKDESNIVTQGGHK